MSGKLHAFTMPKWGIEMTEGVIAEWVMPEGQPFKKGEIVALIESDKIANEVEALWDGVIVRRVAEAGETLPVGALLAVIAEGDVSQEDVDAMVRRFGGPTGAAPKPAAAETPRQVEEPEAVPQQGSVAAPAPAEPAAAPATAAFDDEHVPASPEARRAGRELGIDLTTVTGTGRGGRITRQDVEIAAARAERSIGGGFVVSAVNVSPAARTLAELLELPLDGIAGSGRGGRITRQDVEIAARRAGKSLDEIATAREAVKASPLARRLAEQFNLSLDGVQGSGPRGRITRQDVEAAGRQATLQGGDNPYRAEKLSSMRRTIAQRLEEAKRTIPHFYLTADVELDALLAIRAQANQRAGAEKLSVNDFLIRAAALALKQLPDCNVQFVDGERRVFEHADVSVAVAVEGGLITPVIRSAEAKNVDQIGAEMRDLAARARTGKLLPEDYKGGTFSISNLGMFGIKHFDAVINPPQGAILAVGAGEKRYVVRDDAPAVATVMTVTLSCDHRVIDGALGAQWLAAFKALVETPISLLL